MNDRNSTSGFDIGQSLENLLNKLFEFLPQLLGFILLIVIGYLVAKIVGSLVKKALQKARFDRALHNSAAGNYIARFVDRPSRFTGKLVFWLIFLFFLSMALSALQLPLLDQIVGQIYAYIPKIVSAVVIFLVASAISAGTARFVMGVMGRTPTAKLITTVVPVVVLSIATFMILNQLGIARDIVNILFTAIVGSVALGMALAFGLGGRDVARELLEQAYNSGKQNAGQAKSDMQRATRNTKRQAERLNDNV